VPDTMSGGYLARPAPSGLADVVELVLDKGLVIDAYARVSLVGIEILTLDARIVISSVDTYLRFAEATNRLDLEAVGPPDLIDKSLDVVEKVAEKVVQHKVEDIKDRVTDKAHRVVDAVEDAAGDAVDAVKRLGHHD
jgi:gas vesicle structural protein